MILNHRLDERLLAQQFELSAHVGAFREAPALGFLGDHFLRDQVVQDRLARLFIVGLALRGALLDDEVEPGLRDGFAVHRHRLCGAAGLRGRGLRPDGRGDAQGQRDDQTEGA